ncbi:MAG: hypothetical protein LBG28_10160 [Tannerella sp.]|jgi:hypothetical protein|nr:hypothetical protein [Tannerella sp.]
MKEISRKKFLRVCGSIVAGGAVAGVSGVLVNRNRMLTTSVPSGNLRGRDEGALASPYRQVALVDFPDAIQSLAQHDGTVYVAMQNEVSTMDMRGKLKGGFTVANGVIRDMAVDGGEVYLLHPTSVSVYSQQGRLLREWTACSEQSNYCSLALSGEFVFVTDMDYKNICKYTRNGDFVTFIGSPNGFVIPSLTFGIECIGDTIYCSNSGRHQVEKYTLDGKYIGSFGKAGGAPGLFAGCCNPVHLSCTSSGDIITSEKGNPRISCYGHDGIFHGILLDRKLLGGGYTAYDVKAWNDRLFVAGKNKVSIFRFDSTLASTGACASCSVGCSLRTDAIQ